MHKEIWNGIWGTLGPIAVGTLDRTRSLAGRTLDRPPQRSFHGKHLQPVLGEPEVQIDSPISRLETILGLTMDELQSLMSQFAKGEQWFTTETAIRPITTIAVLRAEMHEVDGSGKSLTVLMYEEARRHFEQLIAEKMARKDNTGKISRMDRRDYDSVSLMATTPEELNLPEGIDEVDLVRIELLGINRSPRDKQGTRDEVLQEILNDLEIKIGRTWGQNFRTRFFAFSTEQQVNFLAVELLRYFEYALWETSIDENVASAVAQMYNKEQIKAQLQHLASEQPHLYAFITAFIDNPLAKGNYQHTHSTERLVVAQFMRLVGQIIGYRLIKKTTHFPVPSQKVVDHAFGKSQETVKIDHRLQGSYALLKLFAKYRDTGTLGIVEDENEKATAEGMSLYNELYTYLITEFSVVATKMGAFTIRMAKGKNLTINEMIEQLRTVQTDEAFAEQIAQFLEVLEKVIETGKGSVNWPFAVIPKVARVRSDRRGQNLQETDAVDQRIIDRLSRRDPATTKK